ncbi:MAG: nucleotide exchange factor GrpE [Verrucomicrobiota bacterium]|jgi:molecular chaperone GrpE|nr:nucleotide exchange factor GrpE [Verrucomicrobiota bacterium]|tara:strand:- start:1880 stop:2563 length:684 start_codon:yes stop_codon:yes gene_type:complete
MSSEGKEENQKANHIEITDSEEKDTSIQAESEQESQALGQAEGEPEPDEPVTEEEEELPPPTPGELKELRQQAAKAEEYYDRLQRQVAEADNLRKRLAKEKQDAIRYANESLIEELLPTMDSFEMAISAVRNSDDNSIDSLKTGIEMVYTQLKRTLQEIGVTEIDATGQAFDPSQHEAMSRKKTDEAEEGTVLEQTRKGYRLRDRLLRAASVVVATPLDDAEEETEQ